eukprot:s1528_g1.t1
MPPGLYQPVNYSEQFDLQWKLALETRKVDGSIAPSTSRVILKESGVCFNLKYDHKAEKSERPGSDYALESSVRLDNCALNDMIASTFGQQDYLNCTETQREEHERLERGISRSNFVTLDVSRFVGSDALDVGCGFGRWTAMLQSIGAKAGHRGVTSVDASPNAVKSTRRFNPDTHQMPGFKIVTSALREGGVLFMQVYNDRAKAGFHYTQSFRTRFHQLETEEQKLDFLRNTHRAAGADIFDHLDGMLTFYNWDYWKVWNYKYLGRKRPLLAPVRDDQGILLRASAKGSGHFAAEKILAFSPCGTAAVCADENGTAGVVEVGVIFGFSCLAHIPDYSISDSLALLFRFAFAPSSVRRDLIAANAANPKSQGPFTMSGQLVSKVLEEALAEKSGTHRGWVISGFPNTLEDLTGTWPEALAFYSDAPPTPADPPKKAKEVEAVNLDDVKFKELSWVTDDWKPDVMVFVNSAREVCQARSESSGDMIEKEFQTGMDQWLKDSYQAGLDNGTSLGLPWERRATVPGS